MEYVTFGTVLRYVASRKKKSSGGRDATMMNSAENFRHAASVSPDDRRDDDDSDADKSHYDMSTGAIDIHVYALPNNTQRP